MTKSLADALTAVFNMSKIQIWKRITTREGYISKDKELYLICQRYKFESESQHSCCLHWRCFLCQRYKFESESQHTCCELCYDCAVFNMSKIQIWKRITTILSETKRIIKLYLICQRYKFESESQHALLCSIALYSCI